MKRERDQSIGLRIDDPILINTTYAITNIVENGSADFIDSTNELICFYYYENSLDGKINITQFTVEAPYIVSGTFEFTTALTGCDTIRVTDGRFDLNYIP